MASAHVAIKSMDSIISTDDPTVGQAMEALASWEAESAAPAATPETAPAAASVRHASAMRGMLGRASVTSPGAPQPKLASSKTAPKSAMHNP